MREIGSFVKESFTSREIGSFERDAFILGEMIRILHQELFPRGVHFWTLSI